MPVHTGSCMYGHVGAVNEGAAVFSGSCGKCFEMKCDPRGVTDAYGMYIDRSNDCMSQEPVQIVVTDNCPCFKEGNEFSNARWCCGDMDHFDIGVWAFREMASQDKGVVPIKYRQIQCPDWLTQSYKSDQTESSMGRQWNSEIAATGQLQVNGQNDGSSDNNDNSNQKYDSYSNKQDDSYNQQFDSSSNKQYDSNNQQYDSYGNKQDDSNNQQYDSYGNKQYDSYGNKQYDSNNQQYDSYGNKQYDSNNQQYDSYGNKQYDSNNQQYDSYGNKQYDSNNQQYDSYGNKQYN
eukprot:gene30310-35300_t